MNTKKKFLMDVVAIRLLLIFLLVVYHALCIYTGAWESPFSPAINITIYEWLGVLIHMSQLESMVFISGLLLGHYASIKPKTLSFHSCVVKKAKRILLPCLFFGIIYYVMFYDLKAPWYSIIWKVLNGCGHLWFLPMIFWCFVLVYIISITPPLYSHSQTAANRMFKLAFVLAFMLSIMNPFVSVPFGLGQAGNFFVYFSMGYGIKTKRLSLPRATRQNILIAFVLFIVSFLLFMAIRTYMQMGNTLVERVTRVILSNICHTTNALSAIYLIFTFANHKSVLSYFDNKTVLITLSGYCYGVYIYQQFILKLLYQHTQLPSAVGAYWLPWIAATMTIILSLLLCHYSLKTRLGRFLIG